MSTTRSSGPVAGRKLTKTKHEGIYARGSTYVVRYRTPDGKQRQQACRTVDEAKLAQAEYASHKQDGSYREPSRLTVNEYAAEWLASYTGRTARGIRPETLKGYGAQLRVHVLPTLGRKRLTALGPRDVKQLATELRGKGLATNSVRLALAPLKAMLACAYEDELIKANPALNVRLATPQTDAGGAVEVKVKALSPDELSRLLAEIPAQWRLLPELLAVSGLRIGEALALDWASVDFGRGRVLVRRRWYRGTFAPPKSRYGRRDVPITPAMTQRLLGAPEGRARRG